MKFWGTPKDLETAVCVMQHPSITDKLLIPEIERELLYHKFIGGKLRS